MSLVFADFRAPNAASDLALENAKLALSDTPAQTAAKLGAAKKILTDFTARHGLPWPHHFDGDYWDNEFGRRFAIHSIPAVFLIGKDGRMVTIEAHGADLEPAVKRALGL